MSEVELSTPQTDKKQFPVIPMSAPSIGESDMDAVAKTLSSGSLSRGPAVKRFEELLAAQHSCTHAVAVSSGTAGLHLALLASGVKPGSRVATSPFSFVASVNAILYCGAEPVFVDVLDSTLCIDPGGLQEAKADFWLPVDVFGLCCHLPPPPPDVRVVIDACESVGARRSLPYSSSAVLAFYPNKLMTTGEGGAILTNDVEFANICRQLRNHGRDEESGEIVRLGYNYRMDEMSAALGWSQLRRMSVLQMNRRAVESWYRERLGGLNGIRMMYHPVGIPRSPFVYVIRLEDSSLRVKVESALQEAGIECRQYFSPPLHLLPHLRRFGYRPGQFPVAEHASETCLALPFSSDMEEDQVDKVCEVIRRCCR